MWAELIGIYPVSAPKPCHLIELRLFAADSNVELGEITQELPGQPRSHWQVPYDEWLLVEDGSDGQLAPFPGPIAAKGDIRVAFFSTI